ncbi:Cytosine permease [Cedecea lapagei]|uniref:Cytosine permease n=1 Tax=Cedecea lapagei TaxID=158823 RepID=A0A3S4IG57_9ENTR|nr:cytosine permease [Cedecea lapagei]VEB95876.1 Cytosine permease [Cedecea lapagei]
MANANNEYEHQPVPLEARKSLFSVAVVWAGFPMVMVGAFVGAQIVVSLGFLKGLLAIVLGNIVLAAYVACLSALAAKQGKTFAFSCQAIFGKVGAKVIAVFLAGLVVGWFAVQTGLAGHGLNTLLGLPLGWSVALGGALFTALSMAGIKMLKPISLVSITLFILTGIISMVLNFQHHQWSEVVNYRPASGHALALGIGVTMAISVFVDSGTLTADFTRWSKTPAQAVVASLCAFPFANILPMLLGGLVAASGEAVDGDFAHLLLNLGPAFGLFAALFFVINCASVATHGLYNAAAGWSAVLPLSFRQLVVVLGIVGTLLALAGITDWLVGWLSLLGIVVPGIGGAIIGWMVMGQQRFTPYRLLAAWGFSIICSSITSLHAPEYSVALVSIVSAFIFSVISLSLSPKTAWSHKGEVNDNA